MVRIEAKPVLHAEFDHGIGQDLLDAGALDLSCGESVAGNSWIFAENNLDAAGRDLAAIQHTIVGQRARRSRAIVAATEIVLSAAIQGEVRRQNVPVLIEKSDQPAVVVVVAV